MRGVCVGLVVSGLIGVVAGVGACGDEYPPVADPGGGYSSSGVTSSGGASGDGGPEAATLSDGARPGAERLCDPLPQRGASVEETVYPGTPPPAVGGTIQPGTYELIIIERYTGADAPPPAEDQDGGEDIPPPPASDQAGRATLYVLGNAVRFVESYGAVGALPQDSTRGVSYIVKGTGLETLEECPSAGKTKTIPFTVAGTTIALFTDGSHRQVFQRTLE
jgi:hypothetical protein